MKLILLKVLARLRQIVWFDELVDVVCACGAFTVFLFFVFLAAFLLWGEVWLQVATRKDF